MPKTDDKPQNDKVSVVINGILMADFGHAMPIVSLRWHTDSQGDPYQANSSVYVERANAIFDAGKALINEQARSPAIGVIYAVEMNALQEKAAEKLAELDPGKDSSDKKAKKIIAKATRDAAVILQKMEKRKQLKSQAQKGENVEYEDDWLKRLQAKDYELISSKTRDVQITVYPDGKGGQIISYAKPLSNVSSLSRSGEPPVLPNFWKTVSVHVDKDGNELSRREAYRSASLSPFEEKDKDERLRKAEEIARFEMRQYAFDRLQKALSSDPLPTQAELDKLLRFDFLNMSLQSPMHGEWHSVKEGSDTYKKIAKEGVTFTSEQIAALNGLIAAKSSTLQIDPNKKIEPNIVFLSLGTNIVRGEDSKGLQKGLNDHARMALQNKLVERLNEQPSGRSEIIALLVRYNPMTRHGLKKLEKSIIKYQSSDPKPSREDLEPIILFREFSRLNKSKQNNCLYSQLMNGSDDNYLQQESAMALAEHLGFVVKGNCQSGKDRTGLLFAAVEAAQIQRDYQETPGAINKKEFWKEQLPLATRNTTGREITKVNCPGANGLQGQSYPLISPSGFRKRIGATRQDRVSRVHKAPYSQNKFAVSNKDEALYSDVAKRASQFDSPEPKPHEVEEMLDEALELSQARPYDQAKHDSLCSDFEALVRETKENSSISPSQQQKLDEKLDKLRNMQRDMSYSVSSAQSPRLSSSARLRAAVSRLASERRAASQASASEARKSPEGHTSGQSSQADEEAALRAEADENFTVEVENLPDDLSDKIQSAADNKPIQAQAQAQIPTQTSSGLDGSSIESQQGSRKRKRHGHIDRDYHQRLDDLAKRVKVIIDGADNDHRERIEEITRVVQERVQEKMQERMDNPPKDSERKRSRPPEDGPNFEPERSRARKRSS